MRYYIYELLEAIDKQVRNNNNDFLGFAITINWKFHYCNIQSLTVDGTVKKL